MRKHTQPFCLLLLAIIAMSCNKDLGLRPEVNIEKTQELEDFTGRYALLFSTATNEDIMIETEIAYSDTTEHIINHRLKIPAGTENADMCFDVACIPNKEKGTEYTLSLTKVYGDCSIGDSSKIKFTITD